MARFYVHGAVRASKYIGEYEADTPEQACELAWADAYVSFCHQCSGEAENPEIEDLFASPVEDRDSDASLAENAAGG